MNLEDKMFLNQTAIPHNNDGLIQVIKHEKHLKTAK